MDKIPDYNIIALLFVIFFNYDWTMAGGVINRYIRVTLTE